MSAKLSDLYSREDFLDPSFRKQMLIEIERELLAQDFRKFVKEAWPLISPGTKIIWNWHMDIICELLQLCSQEKIKRLLITLPPGISKTSLVSILFPVWTWINNPTKIFLTASHTDSLVSTISKASRDLIKTDWFQERWGKGTNHNIWFSREEMNKVKDFMIKPGGRRISTMVGGGPTGRHADFLIADDLVKAQDAQGRPGINGDKVRQATDFWTKTLSTRTKKGSDVVKILVMQRLHWEDPAQWCIDSGEYVHLNLPQEAEREYRTTIWKLKNGTYISCNTEKQIEEQQNLGSELIFEDNRQDKELIFPQLQSKDHIESQKFSLGPTLYACQQQQRPSPLSGGSFNIENFQWYEPEEEFIKSLFSSPGKTIITVDCSFKDSATADYVVAQIWRAKDRKSPQGSFATPEFYLIDQRRLRTNVKGTVQQIVELYSLYPGNKEIWIEEKANGNAVMESLSQQLNHISIAIKPFNPGSDSKTARAEAIMHLIEDHLVFFPRTTPTSSAYCLNLDDLKEEFRTFPGSRNDDQVDCLTMALSILNNTTLQIQLASLFG